MEVDFHSRRLLAAPGRVMVPRVASERLVDAAAAKVGGCPLRVADVGTGSGAIAVALALGCPEVQIWATDVSADAVELARANARRYGLADRVHLLVGDLLQGVPAGLDLVVANLPYVPEGSPLGPCYDREPEQALYAPGDGLDPYRRLLDQSARRLAPHGWVLLQLHGEIVEASRNELDELRERLPELALSLAA